jgi:hypothetical protein
VAINISHVVITGIPKPNSIMRLYDRIEASINVSDKIEIEGHIIIQGSSSNWYSLIGSSDDEPNIESSNLMFLLGIVAQRIFTEGD